MGDRDLRWDSAAVRPGDRNERDVEPERVRRHDLPSPGRQLYGPSYQHLHPRPTSRQTQPGPFQQVRLSGRTQVPSQNFQTPNLKKVKSFKHKTLWLKLNIFSCEWQL